MRQINIYSYFVIVNIKIWFKTYGQFAQKGSRNV